MTRILLIPIAGTIAAIVAIAFARQPREPEPAAPELPPFDFPDAPEHAELPEEEEPPPSEPEAAPEPKPEPREFQLQLESDGSILDLESRVTYASLDDLAKGIGDARHTLVLANGKGVTEKSLDDALVRLRDRYKVVKVYSAPETPPGEGR